MVGGGGSLAGRVALAAVAAAFAVPLESQVRFGTQSALVVLSATAVDGNGRPVPDLRPDELRVFDEGRLQKLEHFAQGRVSQARLLLLLDASGSMSGRLKTTSARMAAVQILSSLDPEDEVALAGFDHRYFGLVRFSRNRQEILAAFDAVERFGSTALHDALDRGAQDLASHGEGRRAIVVITDGIDTSSRKTPDEVIARSRALDVPIYSVSVLSPLDDPSSPRFAGKERPAAGTLGSELLARYARMSGGAAFVVSEFGALQQAAARIVGELKHQYRLGYDAPPGPSRFRRIEVRTTRKGVVVRTRSGYVPAS
jgi:Ca-activated chloride channel family protein